MKQNYERMKKLNGLTANRSNGKKRMGKRAVNRRCEVNRELGDPEQCGNEPDLGLIEILVYFCYRFCLLTSRLATLALVCYLFQQWLFIALAAHILITYCSSCACLSVPRPPHSRLRQQLSLFVVCLLSFVELFAHQRTELANFRKCVAYYTLYLAQNVAVSTYWLVRTVLDVQPRPTSDLIPILANSVNHTAIPSESTSAYPPVSPTTTMCYATLVYLCIILFTMFGLILKFLHLHILRKRRRQNII